MANSATSKNVTKQNHPVVIDKAPRSISQSKEMNLIFDSKFFSLYHVSCSESEDHGDSKGYGSQGNCVCIRDNVSGKMQEMDAEEAMIFLAKKFAAHCENPDQNCPYILEHITSCPIVLGAK